MNKNISNDSDDPKKRVCEKGGICDFRGSRAFSDLDKDCYECVKCRDYYFIYEDEMK